jgi:hypothetical protein
VEELITRSWSRRHLLRPSVVGTRGCQPAFRTPEHRHSRPAHRRPNDSSGNRKTVIVSTIFAFFIGSVPITPKYLGMIGIAYTSSTLRYQPISRRQISDRYGGGRRRNQQPGGRIYRYQALIYTLNRVVLETPGKSRKILVDQTTREALSRLHSHAADEYRYAAVIEDQMTNDELKLYHQPEPEAASLYGG